MFRSIPTRPLEPGQRIRVLVVDDSVVIRRLVCHALEEEPAIEVVGVAANGSIALSRLSQLNPDVITLDVEMPEMDGIQMLRQLRRTDQKVRVIMFSTRTERGAAATLDALALGADDYVTKASNTGSLDVSLSNLRKELTPKIRQFFRFQNVEPQPAAPLSEAVARELPVVPRSTFRPRAIGIGVSTGGPAALGQIISQFPPELPVPVFLVQHMPALFTRFLAERLDAVSALKVAEAGDGEQVRPGHLYVAPGDYHMTIVETAEGPVVRLDQTAPLNSCRPAVDALFDSIAETYGGSAAVAVLTGMGKDGLEGARRLRAKGAYILAQDEASSVVWGMPGAVARESLADRVLPLSEVVPQLLRLL